MKDSRMLWMNYQRESISSKVKDGKKKFSFHSRGTTTKIPQVQRKVQQIALVICRDMG